jgi:regulator of protease activity HflC (stomatin/prohibitin superfamily)
LPNKEKAKQEAELEIQLQAADYAVQVAEQKALEDLAKAPGQASANLAIAQAEANAIELVSQANAEAYAAKIREIAAQLGIDPLTATQDQIDSLLSYIKYLEYLATWDGKLPEFVTDGSGIIVQP